MAITWIYGESGMDPMVRKDLDNFFKRSNGNMIKLINGSARHI